MVLQHREASYVLRHLRYRAGWRTSAAGPADRRELRVAPARAHQLEAWADALVADIAAEHSTSGEVVAATVARHVERSA